jgi:iron complex transport system ATP-binding protein
MVALGRIPHVGRFAAPTAHDDAAVETAMADSDILHLADRRVDSLSGGERARAKFARILAGESDWILADEPLANLDPPHQRDTLRLLKQAAQSGKGVVVVLHQLNAAARLADDLLLLKQGRTFGFGPCSEVLTQEALMATFDMDMEIVNLDGRTAILPR